MRPIKFRAWDKEKEAMIYILEEIHFGHLGEGKTISTWIKTPTGYSRQLVFGENAELMQFTGLHDKNGRDVFEGDVLKIDGGGEIIPVVVSYKDASFGITWPEGNFAELKYYFDMPFCDVEVHGNIYENPELLAHPTPKERR